MTDYTTRTKKIPFEVTLIGVAGGSGSGKTTFAKKLLHRLESEFGQGSCTVISQDSYYIDQSHRFDQDGGKVNFDHPDALDFRLLCTHLRALHEKESIEIPIYDFATHKRLPHTHALQPVPFIIVDGTLILSQPEIVNQLDGAVFLDVPESTRFERRLKRDTQERGRTPEGVQKQFTLQVKPMHDQYVQPSHEHATWVIPHDEGNERLSAILNEVTDWAMGEILNITDGPDHLKAPLGVFKHAPKLAVFDFDSTLVMNEGIDELARTKGSDVFNQVQALTEKAMRGELGFHEAFIQRMSCMKTLTTADIETTQKRIQLRKGAKELIQYLKSKGSEIVILSGGFSWFIDPVAKELGVDHVDCHRFSIPLSISKDEIIGAEQKRDLLLSRMNEKKLKPSEVWVFGDGANDRLMMRCAGIRIAVQAKPKLKIESNIQIDSGDLAVLQRWHKELNRG